MRRVDAQVVPAALVYSRVRILGAPASIASMVLQAACLGARDSVTPLRVVLIASAVNGLCDWVTVCRMGMGVFGAAAATASAETVSMLLLGTAVWKAQGERYVLRVQREYHLRCWNEASCGRDVCTASYGRRRNPHR